MTFCSRNSNNCAKFLKDPNNTAIAGFAYDALGRRVEKKDLVDANNTRRYYYNDNWQVVCEYDGSDVYQRLFVYGNYIDEVLFTRIAGPATRKWYVHAHLYSPAALVNIYGTVQERCEYDAYGEVAIMDGSYNPRSESLYGNQYYFTGRRVDFLDDGNLTLQHNRNRYYDYYTGRWLTHDPLGITPNPPKPNVFLPAYQYRDGLSLYEYVKSNPVNSRDSFGTAECGVCFCVSSLSIEDVELVPREAPTPIYNARGVGVNFTVKLTGKWKKWGKPTKGPKIFWMEKFTRKPSWWDWQYWFKKPNKWHIIREFSVSGSLADCNRERTYSFSDHAGTWSGLHKEVSQHMQWTIRACSTRGCEGGGCQIVTAEHRYSAYNNVVQENRFNY